MGAYRTLLTHLSARYDAGERREAWPSIASSSSVAAATSTAAGAASAADARPPPRCHVSTALLPAIEALAESGDTSTAVAFDLMVPDPRATQRTSLCCPLVPWPATRPATHPAGYGR